MLNTCKKISYKFWRIFVLLAVPLIFLPLVVIINTRESKCAYVVILIVIYWTTEVVELPVTSLLPVILFPLLGIVPTEKVCQHYLEDNNMFFLGNLIMGIAAENCNLHRRLALKVLLKFGNNPKWVMLGLMLLSGFISTIISSACIPLMIPILDVVINEVNKNSPNGSDCLEHDVCTVENKKVRLSSVNSSDNLMNKDEDLTECKRKEKVRKYFYLSVTYAANIGGFLLLSNGGPNLVLKFVTAQIYHNKVSIDYINWLIFSLPVFLLCILPCWCVFVCFFFRQNLNNQSNERTNDDKTTEAIKKMYQELGPLKCKEILVLSSFCIMVCLWMFRAPHFMPGWSLIFGEIKPNDTAVSILAALLLLLLPYQISDLKPCLTWKYVEKNLQWGVLLLRGGGFAVAGAINDTGLGTWIGNELSNLEFLPKEAFVIIIVIIAAFFTEIISNTAAATIILPIAAEITMSVQISPLMTIIPASMACGFGFMLPIGATANAVSCMHAQISAKDMVLPGLIVKCICVSVTLLCLYGYGHYLFDFHTLPGFLPEDAKISFNSTNAETANNITNAIKI